VSPPTPQSSNGCSSIAASWTRALSNYKRAIALGNSRSLPELFEAAGCEFDFSPGKLAELLELARRELA
jgi:oligoendopeptidase F